MFSNKTFIRFKKNKTLYILLVLLVISIAFLLRYAFFKNGDFYFLVDQSRDMLLTKSIVFDHKLTLIGGRTGFGGLFHGPLWIYLLIPTFLITHGNPFLTLIPMYLIVSVGTVILGFFVGKKLYGERLGLIIALFLAVSDTLRAAVPYTTNAQVLPLIVLLYLYSIIEFIRGKNKFLVLAAFTIGLGFQFESAFAFLLIPLSFVAIILRRSIPNIKILFLSLIAFVTPLLSFIIFDLRHDFLMTKSFTRLFTVHIKPLPGFEKYASIDFRITDRLNALINSLFGPLFDANVFMKIFILVIFGLGLLLFIKEVKKVKSIKEENKEYLFLLLSPIIIFGIYILYPLPLWPHYILPISIFTILLASLSIKKILEIRILKYITLLFIIILFAQSSLSLIPGYKSSNPFEHDAGSFKNQVEAVNWVISDANGQDYGYFEYDPGILTYNMDYLMWWINKNEGKLLPQSLKKPVTYLIMFPSGPNNDAHEFWKKNVIHTNGKILETKIFPSGIRVEKLAITEVEENVDPNYYQNLIFR